MAVWKGKLLEREKRLVFDRRFEVRSLLILSLLGYTFGVVF
jgi:hypothetical protein